MARRRGLAEQATLLAAAEVDSPIGAEGHRMRMRGRLLTAGPDALADYEMLEMALFLALPRRDTKPIARLLLARFGSLAGAVAAPVQELRGIDGLGEAGIAALKLLHGAALRLLRADVMGRPVLSNWAALTDYLNACLARERIEHCRVLFVDTRNRLIADEAQGRGTINHTPIYPREIIRRAIELNAAAVLLVHNHPSGDPTPSREDVAMTQEVKLALAAAGIVLHDHIVVGNGKWVSFRQTGLL